MYNTSHIPTEWICNSKTYRRYCYLIGLTCGFIAYIFWTIAPTLEDAARHSNIMILAYCLAGIAVFWFIYAVTIAGDLKQVLFTPGYLYVEGEKIDFKHIRSVHFVKPLIRTYGLRFCITFEPGSTQKEKVYFSMKFHRKRWSRLANPDCYDFRSQFIDVMMTWVAKRKGASLVNMPIPSRTQQDGYNQSTGLDTIPASVPELPARHKRPASVSKTSISHEVPREWVCNSKAYGRLLYVIGSMFCLVAFVAWVTAHDPEFAEKFPNSMIYAYLSAGVAAFCFWYGFSKAGHLKPVRFTPHFVCVNRKKIDLKYIRSIDFVEAFRGKQGIVLGFHFCMTFEPNHIQQDDVHFSMEFHKGRWLTKLMTDHESYDFRSEFIDVVMAWADERKKACTTDMQTFEHVPQGWDR